jgi:hypothetical protein
MAARFLFSEPPGTLHWSRAFRTSLLSGEAPSEEARSGASALVEWNREVFRLVDIGAALPMATSASQSDVTALDVGAYAVHLAYSVASLQWIAEGRTEAAADSFISRARFMRLFDIERGPSWLSKAISVDGLVSDLQLLLSDESMAASRLNEIDAALAGIYAPDEVEQVARDVGLRLGNVMSRATYAPTGAARPFWTRMRSQLIRVTSECITLMRQSWPVRLAQLNVLDRLIQGDAGIWRTWMIQECRNVPTNIARVTARLRAARLAVAVEQYRRTHRALPSSLRDVAGGADADVNSDPYTGEPMKFLPESDGGYVIYSVGLDGRDDGGQISRRDRSGDVPADAGVRVRGTLR